MDIPRGAYRPFYSHDQGKTFDISLLQTMVNSIKYENFKSSKGQSLHIWTSLFK